MRVRRLSHAFFVILLLLLSWAPSSGQVTISDLTGQLKSARNDSSRLSVYTAIGHYYRFTHPDSASYFLQDGINQFTSRKYQQGVATLTSLSGILEADKGNLDLATVRQNDALKIFGAVNSKSGMGMVYNELGNLDCRRGNFDSAARQFINALKATEESRYSPGIIASYINLGHVNESSKNDEKALDYYNKALALINDSGEVRNTCSIYNSMGLIYCRKGDLEKSMGYLQKALARVPRDKFSGLYATTQRNLGIVHTRFGEYHPALVCLTEALQIEKEQGMTDAYAHTLVAMAAVNGVFDAAKAIPQLEEALVISKKLRDQPMLREIYTNLAELNKKVGNYKYVVSLLEDLKKFEDSSSGNTKSREIANLQSIYELEQTNNKLARMKISAQTQTVRRNILIIVVICLVIFLVFVLLYLVKTRQLNVKLSKQEVELKTANSIKDRLFSIIGHDLRTPIGNITMMLDVLEHRITDPDDAEMLQLLRAQSALSMETLDKLLYWGKSQLSGNKILTADFNVFEYITKSFDLLKMNAEQKKISIINRVDKDLSARGDPSHFEFIIRNLLSNAIKFTRSGGLVEVSANWESQPGFIVFCVRDNGMGIKKEVLPDIFLPFVNNARGTANERGTGIGLMLCQEFVKENKGKIWVESVENRGTSFYFTFRSTA